MKFKNLQISKILNIDTVSRSGYSYGVYQKLSLTDTFVFF